MESVSKASPALLALVRSVQLDDNPKVFRISARWQREKRSRLEPLLAFPCLRQLTVNKSEGNLAFSLLGYQRGYYPHGYNYDYFPQIPSASRDQIYAALGQEVIGDLPPMPRALRLEIRTLVATTGTAQRLSFRQLSNVRKVLPNVDALRDSKSEVILRYVCNGAAGWEEVEVEERHGGYFTWEGKRRNHPQGDLPPVFFAIGNSGVARVLRVHGPERVVKRR
jgi:hypothetical protein